MEMHLLCKQKGFLKNPQRLPLNRLMVEYKTTLRKERIVPLRALGKLTDDDYVKLKQAAKQHYGKKVEMQPALAPFWVKQCSAYMGFAPYRPELFEDDNSDFIANNESFESFIDYVLALSFHQFWCHVFYDRFFTDLLIDWLNRAVPLFAIEYMSSMQLIFYDKLFAKTCSVFERLIKFHVSETEFIEPELALQVMRKTKILNTAIIVELCGLYGDRNERFVNDLVKFYYEETVENEHLMEIQNVLRDVLKEFESGLFRMNHEMYILNHATCDVPSSLTLFFIYEIISPILKNAQALSKYFSVCKSVYNVIFDFNFPQKLAFYYEKIFTTISTLHEICLEDESTRIITPNRLVELTDHFLPYARQSFIDLFHLMASNYFTSIFSDEKNEDIQRFLVGKYILLLEEVMEHHNLIVDYNKAYPIVDQLQAFEDKPCNYDPLLYLREELKPILERIDRIEKLNEKIRLMADNEEEDANGAGGDEGNDKEEENDFSTAAETPRFTPEEIDAKISYIQGMLPDLGDGFIYKCLEAMNFDNEWVLASILEKTLPPALNALDRTLIRVPPETRRSETITVGSVRGEKPQKGEVIAYFGKKPEYADARDLLNDKCELKDIKDLVIESARYDDDDDFEDEYYEREPKFPKSYQDLECVSDYDSDEERQEVGKKYVQHVVDKEEEEERLRTHDFCENPAAVRARYEKLRSQKRGSGRPSADVVGVAKGQGQEKDVVKNRNNKTVNKSSRGNHNRKGQARWKYSKGMY